MSVAFTPVPGDTRHAAARHRIPGEEGIWLFVFGDMVMFSLLFAVYLFYRGQSVDVFRAAQTHLNQGFGLLNTVFMLSSSWFVAMAVQATRLQMRRATPMLLLLAFGCGAGFGVVKVFEYSEKIRAGMTLTSNDFFMYYFMLTGIHMVHVVLAMGVLVYLMRLTWSGRHEANTLRNVESGATFWHLVDLLWIVLFGLLYLAR